MVSKESSEDDPSGRVLYHISGRQLDTSQFRNTAFGDLYLERTTQQRIACISFFPMFVTWPYKYQEEGGVWQEATSWGMGDSVPWWQSGLSLRNGNTQMC